MPETRASTQISVRLQLFADLRRFLPAGQTGPLIVALTRGASVRALLAATGIPPGDEITVGLNGEQGQMDSVLHDGDEVVLFSPMEGG